jgi:hypothetical protein
MTLSIQANTSVTSSYNLVEYNNATADSSFLAMMLSCVEDHLALISENGLRKQREMMSRSNVSRDIQQYVNAVDGLINSIVDQSKDKKDLGVSIVEFIKKMGIKINDNGTEKTIDEFGTRNLDKGKLSAIKASLDHEVSRATDIVTQRQMGIQKDMGNFQTCVSMVNSTHSMLSQLNNKLADAMR